MTLYSVGNLGKFNIAYVRLCICFCICNVSTDCNAVDSVRFAKTAKKLFQTQSCKPGQIDVCESSVLVKTLFFAVFASLFAARQLTSLIHRCNCSTTSFATNIFSRHLANYLMNSWSTQKLQFLSDPSPIIGNACHSLTH